MKTIAPLLIIGLLIGLPIRSLAQQPASQAIPSAEYFVSLTKDFIHKAWDSAKNVPATATDDEILATFKEIVLTQPVPGEPDEYWTKRKAGLLDLISFISAAAKWTEKIGGIKQPLTVRPATKDDSPAYYPVSTVWETLIQLKDGSKKRINWVITFSQVKDPVGAKLSGVSVGWRVLGISRNDLQ